MRPPQLPATSRPAKNAFKHAKRAALARRYVLPALLLLAAASAAVLPGSHAAPAKKMAPSYAPAPSPAAAARATTPPLSSYKTLLTAAPLFQETAPPPPLAVYDADCTTPKTSFELGDDVCVTVSGAPTAATPVQRLVLGNPAGFVVSSADVTSSSQTVTFTLPSAGTSGGVDNRGNWIVGVQDIADAELRQAVLIDVHDPNQQVADLTISKNALDGGAPVAGTDVHYQLYIWNRGPDAATNARFTDNTLPNTTFVSLTQDSGPAFTCTSPAAGTAGASTCVRGTGAAPLTFDKGAAAVFTAVYHVNAAIPNNEELTDTATVESDTFDSADTSNSSEVTTTATNPNPPPCTISCPANITQDSDPGQAGAIVNYNAPVTAGSCQPVTTDRPSGSFFPIGTTLVTASAGPGVSCSFTVTVNDNRAVSILVNGSPDMTVECHTGFSDPGASAVDANNQSLPVTATVTVPDPGGAVDQNGDVVQVPAPGNVVDPNVPNTYTITYTASDAGGHTGTATRIVRVQDHAPPVISIAGSQNFGQETVSTPILDGNGDVIGTSTEVIFVTTVECHSAFSAPAATAADGCDATPTSVSVTGSVDPNTVGDYLLQYTSTDSVNNTARQKLKVQVRDTTGPVITLNPGPSTVECHTSYTDPGASAADGCEGPVPVSASGSVDPNTVGTYIITYTASDAGGRTTTATRTIQVVDTIAPTVTLNGPASVTVLQYSSFSDPGATAADGCAGALPVSVSGTVNTNVVGPHVLTYSATDPSGNTGTATRIVTVIYNFTGFFSPVENPPVLNQVKAGQTIPLKFSLMGNQGLGILPAGSPASQQVNCATNAPINDLAETDTPGSSTLTYDAGSDKYQYNWKTEKSWVGQCRLLTVTLNDGTTHTANFKFK